MTGSEILFLLSQGYNLDGMVCYFAEKYDIDENDIREGILEFIDNYRCKDLIDNILGNILN